MTLRTIPMLLVIAFAAAACHSGASTQPQASHQTTSTESPTVRQLLPPSHATASTSTTMPEPIVTQPLITTTTIDPALAANVQRWQGVLNEDEGVVAEDNGQLSSDEELVQNAEQDCDQEEAAEDPEDISCGDISQLEANLPPADAKLQMDQDQESQDQLNLERARGALQAAM
jgi:hypothetical protein